MRLGKPYRRTGRQQRGAGAILKFDGMKENERKWCSKSRHGVG
jgi:hypothetical protein